MRKKKGRIKMWIGIVLVLLGGLLIYWNIPYSPQKHAFDERMQKRAENTKESSEYVTKEEIATLPAPLQRYCAYAGLENFKKYQAAHVFFEDTDFVFDAESGKVLKMDYDLWLFYDSWFRSAYCQSSMFGIPFDGVDYCTEDFQGGMKGILGKMIQIFDVCTEQGYQAGLVSWFAESLTINPSALFSDYVTYEEIDEHSVRVKMADGKTEGEGIITINDKGEITEFYSDDRQVEEIDGESKRIGWRCEYGDYKKQNGILQAGKVKSIKVFPEKEVTYFSAENLQIEYVK